MKIIPPHVAEATRLVRQGRLAEATALLRGAAVPAKPEPVVLRPQPIPPKRKVPLGGVRETPPQGARFEAHVFRSELGERPYKLFIPSTHDGGPAPLIVMLHGCTQSPDDFAVGTQMNAQAEARGFLVVYPGQTSAANPQRCWNWFSADDQRRGEGEPGIIAGIVQAVAMQQAVDTSRVFVAGLSAGGAAAATLGALYPDVFAGVGVHSGLASGAARDLGSALAAMQGGAVASAMTGGAGRPTIVFHGDRDMTVNPVNGDQVFAQAQGAARLSERVEQGSANGRSFTLRRRTDAQGRIVLEQWVVHGGAHTWFGGNATGSHTDSSGPNASAEMVRFFLDR
jgi:poly(hydroxyalkanoate) depolymerase family esterase